MYLPSLFFLEYSLTRLKYSSLRLLSASSSRSISRLATSPERFATQIRRAVVSHLHDVGPNTTVKHKKQLAAMMGHSVTEASTVYAKQLTEEQK